MSLQSCPLLAPSCPPRSVVDGLSVYIYLPAPLLPREAQIKNGLPNSRGKNGTSISRAIRFICNDIGRAIESSVISCRFLRYRRRNRAVAAPRIPFISSINAPYTPCHTPAAQRRSPCNDAFQVLTTQLSGSESAHISVNGGQVFLESVGSFGMISTLRCSRPAPGVKIRAAVPKFASLFFARYPTRFTRRAGTSSPATPRQVRAEYGAEGGDALLPVGVRAGLPGRRRPEVKSAPGRKGLVSAHGNVACNRGRL